MKIWIRVVGAVGLGAGSFGLLGWVNRGIEPVQNAQMEGGGFGPKELFRSESPIARSARVEGSPGGKSLSVDLAMEQPPPPHQASLPSQMLIRTGSLSLEVSQFEKAAAEVARIAKTAGGYVADTRQERRPSGTYRGEITLRIPAERYDGTGDAVKGLGKVLNESSQVQDVTKAFMDVEAKLGVRTEASRRVRELLRNRTGNLKEVLEAEKELARLQEEIEELEGERRFYQHQVRLTTLRVELAEPESISLARPSHWSSLRDAAGDVGFILAGSLATLLRLLVVILPWVGLGWLVLLLYRRVQRKALAS